MRSKFNLKCSGTYFTAEASFYVQVDSGILFVCQD